MPRAPLSGDFSATGEASPKAGALAGGRLGAVVALLRSKGFAVAVTPQEVELPGAALSGCNMGAAVAKVGGRSDGTSASCNTAGAGYTGGDDDGGDGGAGSFLRFVPSEARLFYVVAKRRAQA